MHLHENYETIRIAATTTMKRIKKFSKKIRKDDNHNENFATIEKNVQIRKIGKKWRERWINMAVNSFCSVQPSAIFHYIFTQFCIFISVYIEHFSETTFGWTRDDSMSRMRETKNILTCARKRQRTNHQAAFASIIVFEMPLKESFSKFSSNVKVRWK